MLYTCLRKKICKDKSFNPFHKEKRKNISIIMGNTCGNSCFYTGVAVKHIIAVVRKIRL